MYTFDFTSFNDKAAKTLEHFKQEVSQLRTGKASVQMLDSVRVEAYGGMMTLQEIAQVSAPQADLLEVPPWDKSLVEAIEKAIMSAGLNLRPVVNQSVIKIPVPPLTEERRKEMVKVLQQIVEQSKVMLRNVRTDVKKQIDALKGADGVSEDDIKRVLEELDSKLKSHLDTLDRLQQDKAKELMKV